MALLKLSEKRNAKRYSRSETIIVKAKLANDDFWKEKAALKSVSRLGAGFDIEKSCKIGQLVSLLLALPINLRVYDHEKELYRVWGLVQNCHKLTSDHFNGYHVGVAFIGKDAPESFYENHDQSYRILGINEDGLWKIIETDREFINRRHPRFWVSIRGTLLSGTDEDGKTLEFTTVTENISKSGASIFSETSFVVGDHVKLSLPEFEFESEAIVRNRSGLGNTTPKIHLEFLENEFPVEKLEIKIEE